MDVSIQELKSSTEIDSELLSVIQNRRSYRAFADRSVEPEKIRLLFEAARWAPSSMNEQPWTYIYATKDQPELWKLLLETLNEGNRSWAERAPLLILSMARKKFIRNGVINSSARYDLGSANAFLSLQATALGLNVHQMGGYDRAMAFNNFNIQEEEFELGVVIAVGYPGSPEVLPHNLKERELTPRSRYKTESFAFNTILN